MGDALRAVELFTTDSEEKATELADVLESENIERRKIDEATFSHALELVDEYVDLDSDKAIVLHDDAWHPGVIGIVASRLVEKYYRPRLCFPLLMVLQKVPPAVYPALTYTRLWKNARTCFYSLAVMKQQQVWQLKLRISPEFRKRFNEILNETMREEDIIPEINVDAKISFSEITPKFLRILNQFAPFGPGNMRPGFLCGKC